MFREGHVKGGYILQDHDKGGDVVVHLFSSARGESSAHHLRYTAQCACENKQPAMAYYVDRYVVINVGVRTRTRASSADLGEFSDRNVPRSSATQRAGKSTLVLGLGISANSRIGMYRGAARRRGRGRARWCCARWRPAVSPTGCIPVARGQE